MDTKNNEEADNKNSENERRLRIIESNVDYIKDVIPVLITTSFNNLSELTTSNKEENNE